MEIKAYIEKAKKGDQVAFTYLLDHYWNEVYGFMLKRTENETDAEDYSEWKSTLPPGMDEMAGQFMQPWD